MILYCSKCWNTVLADDNEENVQYSRLENPAIVLIVFLNATSFTTSKISTMMMRSSTTAASRLCLVIVGALLVPGCLSLHFRLLDVLNSDKWVEKEETSSPTTSFLQVHHDDHHKNRSATTDDVQELFFVQRLDHFRSDPRTFQQRYFYSDRYVQKITNDTLSPKPSLALLCVGGEGPYLDKSVLIDSPHCTGDMLEFAKEMKNEYSIHLFALEHRYYGKSYPHFGPNQSPVSNRNLVFLSSRQAIADIAHFIVHQSHVAKSSGGGSIGGAVWLSFGGSYPGMLAAWARLKLPHLIAAAVSSSAPVQQILDMAVYKAHVAKVLADPTVGGSPECLKVVQDGHAELAWAVQNHSRHDEIAGLFDLCGNGQLLQNERNVQLFLGDGVINVPAQENDPSCSEPLCNVEKTCKGLLEFPLTHNSTNILEALAWVSQRQFHACIDIDWKSTIQIIADPVQGQNGGLRSWLWQTCTEMGYYQTCELNSGCPFARGFHPLDLDLLICRKAFGVKPWQVANNVQESIDYYGGWKLQATRVLSVNGAVDPWSELALQKSANTKDRPVYHVPGASHHFWTHPVKATDRKEIQEAREIIFRTLRQWLDELFPRQGYSLGA